MEEVIQDEVKQFIIFLRQFEQHPVNLAGKFNLPVLNVLWKITSGESFEYSDPKLLNLIES